jgi:hypothetical protein
MTQNQIKQIQDICWERINIIENSSSYGVMPHYAVDLYALYYFIMTRSFQKYVENFDLQTVDVEKITMAKDFFKFPAVSPFEKDVAHLLNEMVEGKIRKERATEVQQNFNPVIVDANSIFKIDKTG